MTAPLQGLRVGVTRSRAQASALAVRLRDAGADPVELPVLAFFDPTSWAAFDRSVRDLHTFDGVLFTSVNAVHRALDRATRSGGLSLADRFVAASGTATAAALTERGVRVDLVPPTFHSEALLAGLADRFGAGMSGMRWLLPRAEVAREVLPEGLRALGATVVVAPVYRTGPPEDPAPLRDLLARGLDVVTFASGSSVTHLLSAVGPLPPEVAVVTIGPVTSSACRAAGLTVAAEAESARLESLVEAIVRWRQS